MVSRLNAHVPVRAVDDVDGRCIYVLCGRARARGGSGDRWPMALIWPTSCVEDFIFGPVRFSLPQLQGSNS